MSTTTTDPPQAPRAAAADDAVRRRGRTPARALRVKGEQGKLLRIGVKTKGCSGLAYDMTWADEPGPGDEVVKDKDLTVLVDRKASAVPDRHGDGLRGEGAGVGLHLHQPERKGPLRLRRELPRLTDRPISYRYDWRGDQGSPANAQPLIVPNHDANLTSRP